MKTQTFNLPAHWASTLINGDESGNDDSDTADIAEWLDARPELGACLNCDDEPAFRHWHDAPGVLACDCLAYTFPMRNTAPERSPRAPRADHWDAA